MRFCLCDRNVAYKVHTSVEWQYWTHWFIGFTWIHYILYVGKIRTAETYRKVYTARQKAELEGFYHKTNIITVKQRDLLAQITGLLPRQVKFWFQNRRAKDVRKALNKSVGRPKCAGRTAATSKPNDLPIQQQQQIQSQQRMAAVHNSTIDNQNQLGSGYQIPQSIHPNFTSNYPNMALFRNLWIISLWLFNEFACFCSLVFILFIVSLFSS